jgi:hypothetical protein
MPRRGPVPRFPRRRKRVHGVAVLSAGFGPWAVAPSFDNTHWGAALTVDSLEAKPGCTDINPGCTEPINFAFIQRNGVPEGPPSPQLSTLASSTPNSETLLMNPGDTIRVHMFDAPAPGGGHALESDVADLRTGQNGFMQASAANGFMDTNVATCEGTPFNFEPEYSSASAGNVSPWGAGTQAISAAFELGHFVPCTSLGDPALLPLGGAVLDTRWRPGVLGVPAADRSPVQRGHHLLAGNAERLHGAAAERSREVLSLLDAGLLGDEHGHRMQLGVRQHDERQHVWRFGPVRELQHDRAR